MIKLTSLLKHHFWNGIIAVFQFIYSPLVKLQWIMLCFLLRFFFLSFSISFPHLVHLLLSFNIWRKTKPIRYHNKPERELIAKIKQMISLRLCPISCDSQSSPWPLLKHLYCFLVLLVRVSNDFNLSIESCERVRFISLFFLGPMMQDQLVVASRVIKSMPDPLINSFLVISFFPNKLSQGLTLRFSGSKLRSITNKCEYFSIYFLYKNDKNETNLV